MFLLLPFSWQMFRIDLPVSRFGNFRGLGLLRVPAAASTESHGKSAMMVTVRLTKGDFHATRRVYFFLAGKKLFHCLFQPQQRVGGRMVTRKQYDSPDIAQLVSSISGAGVASKPRGGVAGASHLAPITTHAGA